MPGRSGRCVGRSACRVCPSRVGARRSPAVVRLSAGTAAPMGDTMAKAEWERQVDQLPCHSFASVPARCAGRSEQPQSRRVSHRASAGDRRLSRCARCRLRRLRPGSPRRRSVCGTARSRNRTAPRPPHAAVGRDEHDGVSRTDPVRGAVRGRAPLAGRSRGRAPGGRLCRRHCHSHPDRWYRGCPGAP